MQPGLKLYYTHCLGSDSQSLNERWLRSRVKLDFLLTSHRLLLCQARSLQRPPHWCMVFSLIRPKEMHFGKPCPVKKQAIVFMSPASQTTEAHRYCIHKRLMKSLRRCVCVHVCGIAHVCVCMYRWMSGDDILSSSPPHMLMQDLSLEHRAQQFS